VRAAPVIKNILITRRKHMNIEHIKKLLSSEIHKVSRNISELTRRQTSETKALFKDKNHYRFIPSNTTFDYLPVHSKK
jgi:chromosome segregation and condensation protein ScpB